MITGKITFQIIIRIHPFNMSTKTRSHRYVLTKTIQCATGSSMYFFSDI